MRRWLREKCATPVVVHLTDDSSVSGWLEGSNGDGLLLAAPRLLLDDSDVPLEGQLYVPRERVKFIQTGLKSVEGAR